MRGVPVRIGGGAVLDMRSVPVVIDVQRKCRPGTRVWATARRVDRMWWGETRGYQGGLCQRWGMYVCMYVCMYDYIAVSTRTLTPPTTGADGRCAGARADAQLPGVRCAVLCRAVQRQMRATRTPSENVGMQHRQISAQQLHCNYVAAAAHSAVVPSQHGRCILSRPRPAAAGQCVHRRRETGLAAGPCGHC